MVGNPARGRLVAALAFVFAAVDIASAASATLTVGKAAPNADPIIPVNVGEQLGIFKKHGLDLKIVDFTGGSKMTQAMAAGSARHRRRRRHGNGAGRQGRADDRHLRNRGADSVHRHRRAVGFADQDHRATQRQEDRLFQRRLADRLADQGAGAQAGLAAGRTSPACRSATAHRASSPRSAII